MPTALAAVPAGSGDLEPICDSLQAAFWDDPVMSWIMPSEKSRSRRIALLFRVMLTAHYLPMRTVWTTADQSGAALWAPPGHWEISNGEIMRNVVGLLRAMGSGVTRGLGFLKQVDAQHPKEPHWYLGVLGTSPAHQGKGVGSTLLQPVLQRCDNEGIGAYLESSTASNVPFYSRHGFEVRGEITAKDGPTVWPMWRDPRPPSSSTSA